MFKQIIFALTIFSSTLANTYGALPFKFNKANVDAIAAMACSFENMRGVKNHKKELFHQWQSRIDEEKDAVIIEGACFLELTKDDEGKLKLINGHKLYIELPRTKIEDNNTYFLKGSDIKDLEGFLNENGGINSSDMQMLRDKGMIYSDERDPDLRITGSINNVEIGFNFKNSRYGKQLESIYSKHKWVDGWIGSSVINGVLGFFEKTSNFIANRSIWAANTNRSNIQLLYATGGGSKDGGIDIQSVNYNKYIQALAMTYVPMYGMDGVNMTTGAGYASKSKQYHGVFYRQKDNNVIDNPINIDGQHMVDPRTLGCSQINKTYGSEASHKKITIKDCIAKWHLIDTFKVKPEYTDENITYIDTAVKTIKDPKMVQQYYESLGYTMPEVVALYKELGYELTEEEIKEAYEGFHIDDISKFKEDTTINENFKSASLKAKDKLDELEEGSFTEIDLLNEMKKVWKEDYKNIKNDGIIQFLKKSFNK